ncbi:ORF6C domain-containing protein [Staphylococcus epidermidis]|jgi:prophage antirepressor-like protein|uniref:BRO family protein n=1 Tax=Staphylococcus epidermidis TaxID=1282 RepID=UPI002003C6BB|nr:BRO family protein [Staphylococcus epidermidis]MCG1339246.1 ORF6C domain-containing protein [Staphylococcus epidermidis]MCG1389131.1 ORF6C domain-containing protein [Staphylococcus epidermidis]MCG1415713.1 ORF6C domain-containing protein [Staphylococcus epidermidis]MCG1427671.1 ORF6C domain-containing protein [Staphylococcus epidermidis]MCG1711345.1 ORF6C domain-containing protein [Staphylococcus epidermidis]
MQDLQVFNFEELPVRTMNIDGEPYFVGSDVAKILGYLKPANAIANHVDDEDKTTTLIQGTGSNYKSKAVIINESGLYSLIFSSKLESAKRFKRWVTSEVLPAIRKTGTYQVPDNPMDALKLMFDAQKQTKEEIATVKADVIDIKENQKLDAGEYGLITKTVHQRVAYIRQIHGLPNNKEVNKPLYRDINSNVNTMAGIKTRTQLKQKHFDDVMNMITNWFPSQSTMYVIKQLEMDFENEV